MAHLRDLIAQGYEQVSRKYRRLARLPLGMTGLEALRQADPELASHLERNLEETAKFMYLRIHAKDFVVLTPEEFAAWREMKDHYK